MALVSPATQVAPGATTYEADCCDYLRDGVVFSLAVQHARTGMPRR